MKLKPIPAIIKRSVTKVMDVKEIKEYIKELPVYHPRKYQIGILNKIKNSKYTMLFAVTGSGKTIVVGFAFTSLLQKEPGKRLLISTPTGEIGVGKYFIC